MKRTRSTVAVGTQGAGDRSRQEENSVTRSGAGRSRALVVLNRYRLTERLGAGGFGTVWLARDERLERDVAVKILPRAYVVGGRFEREARAAARLSHPGIVTLFEAVVDDEGAYLVSEVVRGATLSQLLEAGRLSDRDIVRIGIAVCEALSHAHSQGVIHRDIKPSNILISERPSPPLGPVAKLTDFGVARVIGGDTLTRTGDVIGTAAYMAPEQAEGREAGAGADLYSLALVIYEALSGVNPIRSGAAAQRARRLGAHLPPLRRQRRDLPRELGRAVDLALRPRPRERGSVDELRAALADCVDDMQDRPGVVAGPLAVLTDRAGLPGAGRFDDPERLEHGDRDDPTLPGPAPNRAAEHRRDDARSLDRALGAAAAAALAMWAAGHLLAPARLAPLAAGLAAALAVAAFPRAGWLALTMAATGSLCADGRSGAALAVLVAAALPATLMFRHPTRWPLAIAAPMLGLIGLAGAWPAIAARAPSAWQRAALAATGWVWLVLATPLAGTGSYASLHPAPPPRLLWMTSLYESGSRVLAPLLRGGLIAPALIWAAGAAAMPSVVRGCALRTRIARAAGWSAAVVGGTVVVVAIGHSGGTVEIGAATLGGVAAAILALIPERRCAGDTGQPPNIGTGLA